MQSTQRDEILLLSVTHSPRLYASVCVYKFVWAHPVSCTVGIPYRCRCCLQMLRGTAHTGPSAQLRAPLPDAAGDGNAAATTGVLLSVATVGGAEEKTTNNKTLLSFFLDPHFS